MEVNTETIIKELRRIEREEHVRILYACESGSRAWGIASNDSDYDVRFLYVRPVDGYLSIFEQRDVIERPINDWLDLNGWDLKKALNLFRKSNPPLLEWLQSTIRYIEMNSVTERIRQISPLVFSQRSSMLHYLHMAKRNYREYMQDGSSKVKKYFYVIRPVLACQWIEKWGTMPPVDFEQLAEPLLPSSKLKQEVYTLMNWKRSGIERDGELDILEIKDFLKQQMVYLEEAAKQAPIREKNGDEALDVLFREALREAWGISYP